jgi:hypothetical protein
MDDENNKHNGLLTKIWGPSAWINFHAVSFGYPISPSVHQQQQYKQYYISVGDTLPCGHCRDSYKEFISSGCTKLNDSVLKNRKSLTFWAYCIHEAVNNKLGVNYGVTYQDIIDKYEAFRAKCNTTKKEKGCIVPLDKKSQSFKIAAKKDCPIISKDIVDQFIPYGIKRGIKLNRNFDKEILNTKCISIIDNMRQNGIQSIEQSGKYKGLPTTNELELIIMGSSNLNNDELLGCIDKLPNKKHNLLNNKRKIYKLIK